MHPSPSAYAKRSKPNPLTMGRRKSRLIPAKFRSGEKRKSNASRRALREFQTNKNDTSDSISSSAAATSYMNLLPSTIVKKYLKPSSKPSGEPEETRRLSTTAVCSSPTLLTGEYREPTIDHLHSLYDPCDDRTIRKSRKMKNRDPLNTIRRSLFDDDHSLSEVESLVSVELNHESASKIPDGNFLAEALAPLGLGDMQKENCCDTTHSSLTTPYPLVKTGKTPPYSS